VLFTILHCNNDCKIVFFVCRFTADPSSHHYQTNNIVYAVILFVGGRQKNDDDLRACKYTEIRASLPQCSCSGELQPTTACSVAPRHNDRPTRRCQSSLKCRCRCNLVDENTICHDNFFFLTNRLG